MKRRISLGLKQCTENPWEDFASKNKEGDVIDGKIKNITDFGIFVGLTDDLDGLIHASDISRDNSGKEKIKEYSVDQKINQNFRHYLKEFLYQAVNKDTNNR